MIAGRGHSGKNVLNSARPRAPAMGIASAPAARSEPEGWLPTLTRRRLSLEGRLVGSRVDGRTTGKTGPHGVVTRPRVGSGR
jgi:hypothetical protein